MVGERDQWAQPQPEPQPPPDTGAAGAEPPTEAKTDSRRTAPSCPAGQLAGSLASTMGRRSSKTSSHVRQRNSYSGMVPSVGIWLTGHMPWFASTQTDLERDTDQDLQTGSPAHAHIVKTKPGENAQAKVIEARIYGTPLEALCGHVWVPSRDPKSLPLCPECKSIYEMYRLMNDGLNEQPSD